MSKPCTFGTGLSSVTDCQCLAWLLLSSCSTTEAGCIIKIPLGMFVSKSGVLACVQWVPGTPELLSKLLHGHIVEIEFESDRAISSWNLLLQLRL